MLFDECEKCGIGAILTSHKGRRLCEFCIAVEVYDEILRNEPLEGVKDDGQEEG